MESQSEKICLLIEKADAGDHAAATELIESYRAKLRQFVHFRMNPVVRARFDESDVVQEAIIEANKRLPDFLDERLMDFYPWLRKIAWSRLVDLQRRHLGADKRSICNEVTDASANHFFERIGASGISPLSKMVRSELRSRVKDVLQELPENSREILLLRFVEQLSIRESSQILGITETATKSRQLRAIKELSIRLGMNR